MESTLLVTIYSLLFTLSLVGGVIVVFARSAVHSALALIGVMISLAGIFLLIQAPFVALIQVFVYAGAIMVLFLYVVMLLNPRSSTPVPVAVQGRRGIALMLGTMFMLLVTAWSLWANKIADIQFQLSAIGMKQIVAEMLQKYLLPFELTSILLLIAIVGAVTIARRE